jgi:hypothetical protein
MNSNVYIDFKNKKVFTDKKTISYETINDVYDIIKNKLCAIFNKPVKDLLVKMGYKLILVKPNLKVTDKQLNVYYFLNTSKFQSAKREAINKHNNLKNDCKND